MYVASICTCAYVSFVYRMHSGYVGMYCRLLVTLRFLAFAMRSSAGPVVWQRQNCVTSGAEERHRPVRASGIADTRDERV